MSSGSQTEQRAFPALSIGNSAVALQTTAGEWTYSDLHERINKMAAGLLEGKADLKEERIALLIPGGVDYVTTLLGIWRAGGIAVPLNVAGALPELEHALTCAQVTRLVVCLSLDTDQIVAIHILCQALKIEMLTVAETLVDGAGKLPVIAPERRAMILFTSGTTNKPKGVVSTHRNIRAQVTSLLDAWGWQSKDCIPLFLPLHHIHGIINILCCGLWIGARIALFPRFDMEPVMTQVRLRKYTLFMAVPTIYVKIIQHLEALDAGKREAITSAFKAMRLNVSGSAACPVKLFNQWKALTGQTLLERYGMTEIGMAISNPYLGERRAGAVGLPLKGVDVALVDDAGAGIDKDDVPGEIRVRGATVFLEYWNNPAATQESFVDGWFRTGDVAVREKGYYRIMGRSSVDIIKSGGYKLSALEIEGTLLTHEKIAECAVVGMDDETWGEAVTAFVVPKAGQTLTLPELKTWCESRMSPYKIPKSLRLLDAMPRNAMGKVVKPELKKL
jgi:malonyl-CoA/methylmalonyl-CoA synthetase